MFITIAEIIPALTNNVPVLAEAPRLVRDPVGAAAMPWDSAETATTVKVEAIDWIGRIDIGVVVASKDRIWRTRSRRQPADG
jgi:hypothetical protein